MDVFNSCPLHTAVLLDPEERDVVALILRNMVFADGAYDRAESIADDTDTTAANVMAISAKLLDELYMSSVFPNYGNDDDDDDFDDDLDDDLEGTQRPN